MSPVPLSGRVADVRRDLVGLRAELAAWLARRRHLDTLQQFNTQLRVLEEVLQRTLAGIEAALPAANAADVSSATEECRRVSRGIVWARRVWGFFRRRFDQRDDPRLAPVLAAADEVVWSSYAEPFQFAGLDVPSAPLSYVEDRFSPFAVPRRDPPADLRFDVDASFLQSFLTTLPIPVLGLPPFVVNDPWWLVFAGHEVGHHVQYDLMAASALVQGFEQTLAQAVERVHGPEASKRWSAWHLELFADAWSVLVMGPAALWSLLDLEAGAETRLLRRWDGYPPTMIRAAVMQALLVELGVPSDDAVGPEGPATRRTGPPALVDGQDLRADFAADLDVVPTVAACLVHDVVAHGATLPDLARWDAAHFQPHGTVDSWRAGFGGADPPPPVHTLEAARLATSGAVWAWVDLQALGPEKREQRRALLGDRTLKSVAQSREPSVRAAVESPGFAAGDAADMLRALLLDGAPEPVPGPAPEPVPVGGGR